MSIENNIVANKQQTNILILNHIDLPSANPESYLTANQLEMLQSHKMKLLEKEWEKTLNKDQCFSVSR